MPSRRISLEQTSLNHLSHQHADAHSNRLGKTNLPMMNAPDRKRNKKIINQITIIKKNAKQRTQSDLFQRNSVCGTDEMTFAFI